jgi:hypothetical protein
VIRYEDAKLAFAQAIYDLLAHSAGDEWFSIADIAEKAGLETGLAFASRVLSLSREEDDIFHSDSDGYWTLGKEGFDLIEKSADLLEVDHVSSAPAADRIVSFNHNSPEASYIEKRLAEVMDDVRGVNSLDVDEQERLRVYEALQSAKLVWQSSSLRLIQLKVGVLLAAEDAVLLLSKTSRHVAAALLVDAIKAFCKTHLHADLDAI